MPTRTTRDPRAAASHAAGAAARNGSAAALRPIAIGGACWSLLVLFFIGQAVTQAAVAVPYSVIDNAISDLGAARCGPFSLANYQAEVCSPWHPVMNATFVVCGLLTGAGAISTWRAWPAVRRAHWGLALLVLSGAGQVLVGLAPEDTSPVLHLVGSTIGIVLVNVAVLLLGIALWSGQPGLAGADLWTGRAWLAGAAVVAGALGLFGFFIAPATDMPFGLSERLAGYPAVVWLIAAGLVLLRSAARARPAGGKA